MTLKIGDVVKNKYTPDSYGTVHYSSFGFSIHQTVEQEKGLRKTTGAPASEILKHWEVTSMPKGYVVNSYGGIRKAEAEDMWLFVKTNKASVGGNSIKTTVMDIDSFIEKYKDEVFGYIVPDIRPMKLNEVGGALLSSLELHEFEKIFKGRINDMGKILWYYPKSGNVRSKYPFFRKAIYTKHGVKATKDFNHEVRKYEATLL